MFNSLAIQYIIINLLSQEWAGEAEAAQMMYLEPALVDDSVMKFFAEQCLFSAMKRT